MRLLLLATDLHTRGGIARYTSTMAAALGRRFGPNQVDVLSFHDWGPPPTSLQPYRLLGKIGPRATWRTQLAFIARAFDAAGRDDPYTLLIANHVALAPVAWALRLRHSIPYWVACHSIEVWWDMPWTYAFALRRADAVLPVSRFTADRLTQFHHIPPRRMHLVPNVIPDEFAHLLELPAAASPSLEPMLLSVCSLARGMEFKGVDTVLRALPRLLPAHPGLRYVVAGGGDLRPGLEALAARLGLADRVRFAGEVDDAGLAELYRQCDLFVLPSRGQSQQGAFGGEGFGRVYVEAAWAGKPTVASRTGGSAEAIRDGETGLLIDPTSEAELATAIDTLLSDPIRATRLGQAGRIWARANFSPAALLAVLPFDS